MRRRSWAVQSKRSVSSYGIATLPAFLALLLFSACLPASVAGPISINTTTLTATSSSTVSATTSSTSSAAATSSRTTTDASSPSAADTPSRTTTDAASPSASLSALPSPTPTPPPSASSTSSPSHSGSYSASGLGSASASLSTSPSPAPSAISCPEPGTFCGFDVNGFWQKRCNAGRYGNSTTLTDALCSGPCKAGFFCPPGSTSLRQLPCPESAECPENTTLPLPCTAGRFCKGGCSKAPEKVEEDGPNPENCGRCDPGYYCPANSTNSMGQTKNITYKVLDWREGPTIEGYILQVNPPMITNHACPNGTTNGLYGASSEQNCTKCTLGTYSLGKAGGSTTMCPGQCVPGQYGAKEGQSDNDIGKACKDCEAGEYSPVSGSAQCLTCSIGSYTEMKKQSRCIPCAIGTYGIKSGSNSSRECKPCPKGTYSIGEGQALSGCVACPAGTYTSAEGSTRESNCTLCGKGLYTAGDGATNPAACVSLPFPCTTETPPMDSQAPPFPPFFSAGPNASDCKPVNCLPFLGYADSGSGCTGAEFGTYGTALNAIACPSPAPHFFCPGLLSRPLLKPTALSESCALFSAARTPSKFIPTELERLQGGFESTAFTATVGLFGALYLVGGAALLLARERAEALVRGLDAFGLLGSVSEGGSPQMQRSAVGGGFTVLAYGAVACIGLFYVFTALSLDNVVVRPSVAVLHEGLLANFSKYEWLQTQAVPPPALFKSGFTGLQVRLLAMGEEGECAKPLNWTARAGLAEGAWVILNGSITNASATSEVFSSDDSVTYHGSSINATNTSAALYGSSSLVPGCPAGAENFSAITFACDNCTFESQMGLDFTLHYSCQALHLSVVAAGPADSDRGFNKAKKGAVLYSRVLPPANTTGGGTPGAPALLSNIQFTVSVMPAIVVDERTVASSADNLAGRGYVLSGSSFSVATAPLPKQLGAGGGGFFPRHSGVFVGITLTSAGFYSVARVQNLVSSMQLVSQLASLIGLLGLFGTLYAAVKARCSQRLLGVVLHPPGGRRGGGGGALTRPPSAKPGGGQGAGGDGGAFAESNPMRRRTQVHGLTPLPVFSADPQPPPPLLEPPPRGAASPAFWLLRGMRRPPSGEAGGGVRRPSPLRESAGQRGAGGGGEGEAPLEVGAAPDSAPMALPPPPPAAPATPPRGAIHLPPFRFLHIGGGGGGGGEAPPGGEPPVAQPADGGEAAGGQRTRLGALGQEAFNYIMGRT